MVSHNLTSSILGHFAANADYYKLFHTGDVLKDAEGYFIFGNYCDSVFLLIITATSKAINLDLSIYQKGSNGNVQILEQITGTRGGEVYLKIYMGPHYSTNKHYDAILLFDKPTQVCRQDRDNFVSPSPTNLQLIMQDDADKVIDLTEQTEAPRCVPQKCKQWNLAISMLDSKHLRRT